MNSLTYYANFSSWSVDYQYFLGIYGRFHVKIVRSYESVKNNTINKPTLKSLNLTSAMRVNTIIKMCMYLGEK